MSEVLLLVWTVGLSVVRVLLSPAFISTIRRPSILTSLQMEAHWLVVLGGIMATDVSGLRLSRVHHGYSMVALSVCICLYFLSAGGGSVRFNPMRFLTTSKLCPLCSCCS